MTTTVIGTIFHAMTPPAPSLADGFASLRAATAAQAVESRALAALLLAMLARVLGRLEDLIRLWQSGIVPPPPVLAPREHARPVTPAAEPAWSWPTCSWLSWFSAAPLPRLATSSTARADSVQTRLTPSVRTTSRAAPIPHADETPAPPPAAVEHVILPAPSVAAIPLPRHHGALPLPPPHPARAPPLHPAGIAFRLRRLGTSKMLR